MTLFELFSDFIPIREKLPPNLNEGFIEPICCTSKSIQNFPENIKSTHFKIHTHDIKKKNPKKTVSQDSSIQLCIYKNVPYTSHQKININVAKNHIISET